MSVKDERPVSFMQLPEDVLAMICQYVEKVSCATEVFMAYSQDATS